MADSASQAAAGGTDSAGAAQASYLSRLHREWLRTEPERRWRDDAGSLLFFDVSGFTPLTERLAVQGKGGAEELTDILNAVFGGLLGAAEALGGDTLKFGGDALLLLFRGPDHEARACAAAWDMQQVMRGSRRLKTSAGTVSLGASCGIASGPVHSFLVGTIFREFLIGGPTTTAAVSMEHDAHSGEILVAPSTAAELPAGDLGHPHAGGGRPLVARPAVGHGPAPQPDDLALEVPAPGGLSPALVPYLQFTGDGEHRQAAVAFVQVTGLDEALAADGGEAASRVIDELVSWAQRACKRHGVTFLGTDCDAGAFKMMFVAGAPAAGDHDEDRMLLTLRDILDEGSSLPLRAGTHRGRVFAVNLGAAHRRTYTTMGETTNLAARVMGRAPSGALMATEALLSRTRTPFAQTNVDPFKVKGVSAPVHAALLGGVHDEGHWSIREERPLLGREREAASLHGALEAAQQGDRITVRIAGEAGIGKSRLLSELVRHAIERDIPVITVVGQPYDADRVYASLRRPLRELLVEADASDESVRDALRERLDPEARRWMPLVGIPFGLTLPPTAEQRALAPQAARVRLHVELLPVLAELVEPGTLLVVEDLPLIDEASRELINAILTAPEGTPLATVITGRQLGDTLNPPGATTLRLGPLDGAAIATLIELDAEANGPLPPAVAAGIADRAHGHPLFLEELLVAAHAGRDLDDLPDSIEALINAHIDTFAPADRAILRDAAVLGMQFLVPRLAELATVQQPLLMETLQRMTAFVTEDSGPAWAFRQSLVRDAAYEALPYRTRRALHRQAAKLIEKAAGYDLSKVVALLSLHADAAGDHEPSWRYSLAAADQAEQQGAPVEAAVYLRRALAAGRKISGLTGGAVIDVAQRLGDMCELAGLYEHADAAYRDARRLAKDDPMRTAELCRKQGWLRERTGSYSQALRWYTRGLAVIEGKTGVTAVRLHGRLTLAYGAARLRQGRLVEAIEPLEQAVTLARHTDDQASLAHASYLLDWAYTDLGRPDESLREQALRIYTELEDWTGLANVLNNLGVNAFFAGDWGEAEALYERSREARRRGGDVVRYGEALHNMGELLVDQGRLDEAEPRLRRALALWRGAGFPVGIGVALMNLGRSAARRGDDEAAERLLGEAHETLARIGSEQTIDVAVREGEWRLLQRRPDEAIVVLEAARAEARRRGGAPVSLAQIDRLLGLAAAQTGDLGGAITLVERSLGFAEGTRYEVALSTDILTRLQAAAGRPVDDGAARAAQESLDGLGVVRIWPPPILQADARPTDGVEVTTGASA